MNRVCLNYAFQELPQENEKNHHLSIGAVNQTYAQSPKEKSRFLKTSHRPYSLVCDDLSQTSTFRHDILRVALSERYLNTMIHMIIRIYERFKRLRMR